MEEAAVQREEEMFVATFKEGSAHTGIAANTSTTEFFVTKSWNSFIYLKKSSIYICMFVCLCDDKAYYVYFPTLLL
jgi:hypothetical protein